MLVQATPEPSSTYRTQLAQVTTCWRVMCVKKTKQHDRSEHRHVEHAMMVSALAALSECGGAAMDACWSIHPHRQSHRLEMRFSVPHDLADRSRGKALVRQISDALEPRFEFVRAKLRGRGKAVSNPTPHTVAIESTVEEFCLYPVAGTWSAGSPLSVRDSVDWPMLLRLLAHLNMPIAVRMQVSPVNLHELSQQLDDARRRWELQRRIQRRDDAEATTWRDPWGESADKPRRVAQAAPLTSDTKWPTRSLESLAATMALSPVHFAIHVSASHRATARAVAGVFQTAVFEPGTARAVDINGSSGPGSPSRSGLLATARTLCPASGAAHLFTWPRHSTPSAYLLPSTSDYIDRPPRSSWLLGSLHDVFADKTTDLPVRPLWYELNRHALITGLPGSGKSALLTQLLAEAARADPPIPVLTLAFAKDEGTGLARWDKSTDPRLRAYARNLRVYGLHPGAPLQIRVNPFALPDANILEQADHLCRVVRCGIPTEGPLAANLLEAAMHLCRECHGQARLPILTDLAEAVEKVQREKGYSDTVLSDLSGAFASRMTELTCGLNGEVFRCPTSTPSIEDILKYPHYIAIGRVDIEIGAMFLVDLFKRLERHLIRTVGSDSSPNNSRPRLIISMDELQELCPRIRRRGSGDRPDPTLEAAMLVKHMVKVFRAYGVALVKSTQHSGSVEEDLVKAPGTHIAFAQAQETERQELRGLMGLDDQQYEQLNDLPVGHAYYSGPETDRAVRVVIPFEHGVHDLRPLDDQALASRCAASKSDRGETIRRCDAELTLREERYLRAARLLRKDRQAVDELQIALRHADQAAMGDTSGDRTVDRLNQRIASEHEDIRRCVLRRHRAFERDWSQTLCPLPVWLTDWAQTARGSVAQRRSVRELQRRHNRLVRAYERLLTRHLRLTDQNSDSGLLH